MMWKHKLYSLVSLGAIVIGLLVFWNSPYLWLWIASIFSVFFLILSFGVLFLRFQYFYPAIFRNPGKEAILTFDDGPDPALTPRILDILKKHGIHAIFFAIGRKVQEHPEIFQRIISEGHTVGNHTQNHFIFFAMLNTKKAGMEIDSFSETVEPYLSEKPSIFRPPIGYTNPNIARALERRKMKIIAWNVRSYDSFKNKGTLLNRLLKYTKPGSIVLLHDNLVSTADILEEYILQSKANGIVFANQEHLKKFIHEINK